MRNYLHANSPRRCKSWQGRLDAQNRMSTVFFRRIISLVPLAAQLRGPLVLKEILCLANGVSVVYSVAGYTPFISEGAPWMLFVGTYLPKYSPEILTQVFTLQQCHWMSRRTVGLSMATLAILPMA